MDIFILDITSSTPNSQGNLITAQGLRSVSIGLVHALLNIPLYTFLYKEIIFQFLNQFMDFILSSILVRLKVPLVHLMGDNRGCYIATNRNRGIYSIFMKKSNLGLIVGLI